MAVNRPTVRAARVRGSVFLLAALVVSSGLVLVSPGPAMALGATHTDDSGSINPSTVGQSVQITAGIKADLAPGPLPPSFVTFVDGASTVLGIALVVPTYPCFPTFFCDKSYAQISTSSLSIGSHTITAFFSGDTNNAPSVGSYVQMVNPGSSTTPTHNALLQLTATPNPSNAGEAVDFKVTVTPSTGSVTPTGYIHLMNGGYPLGSSQQIDGSGRTTVRIDFLPPGTNSIFAVYEGDGFYRGGSESNVVLQVVIGSADLAVAKSCSSGPLKPGDTVACVVSVTDRGAQTADNVVLTDDLPAGFTAVGTPSGGGFTCTTTTANPEIRCTKSAQTPGTSTVTYTLRVGDDVTPGSTLTNSAVVSSSTADPDRTNNGASANLLIVGCTIDRSSASSAQTIMGTGGDDVICGSAYADDIAAGAGDDLVFGGGGNDRLYGSDGNDRLIGGAGEDQLYGGAGDDWLSGGDGNDTAVGGVGSDTCSAEASAACES